MSESDRTRKLVCALSSLSSVFFSSTNESECVLKCARARDMWERGYQ